MELRTFDDFSSTFRVCANRSVRNFDDDCQSMLDDSSQLSLSSEEDVRFRRFSFDDSFFDDEDEENEASNKKSNSAPSLSMIKQFSFEPNRFDLLDALTW